MNLLEKDLNDRKIDYLTLNSIEYCRLREKYRIEGFIAGIQNKSVTKKLVLVTRKNQINSLRDLKNKKIIIDQANSGDIPFIWLDTLLLKAKLPVHQKFFASVKKTNKPSQSVMPVYFGQDADACILTENAFNVISELNPNIAEKLVVLIVSPAFLSNIFCATPSTARDMKKRLFDLIGDMNVNPKTKQGMALFKMDSLVPFEQEYIKSVEDLIREYDELIKRSER